MEDVLSGRILKSNSFIKVEDLHKEFRKGSTRIEVLKGIDLQIGRGERIAIVGASGVGKTTFLHILGTIERPTSGRILYEGEDIFSLDEDGLAEFRNMNIGFVFQFQYLLPELTGLENVMMPALIRGVMKSEARMLAEELMREVGIAHRMRHKPGELSGGEQQRVAIARALIMEPKVILADEPTGNLDRKTGSHIEDLLIELNRKRNVTLVVVTHNHELAEKMSRQFALVDGKAVTLERR